MDGDTDSIDLMDLAGCGLDEEEDFATGCSRDDAEFDVVIGHIEDIIMEEEFQQLQHNYLEHHYLQFDDTEENKLCYTDIHRGYVDLVETFLKVEITKRVPGFSMQVFTQTLSERKTELEGEVFDLLLTFSDFVAFKELMLDFRAEKEGRSIDLSDGITVMSVQTSDLTVGNLNFSL